MARPDVAPHMEPMLVLAGATFAGIGDSLSVFPDRSRDWASDDE